MHQNEARPAIGSGTGGAMNGYAGGESFSLSIAQRRNPRTTATHHYSPLAEARQCARCGARDRWYRPAHIGGGWLCRCRIPEPPEPDRSSLTHHLCGKGCLLSAAS